MKNSKSITQFYNNFRYCDIMSQRKDLTDAEPVATRLELYGYGKHGEVGDCNVPAPAFYNIVGKKKWEAWNKNKGMNVNEAKVKFLKMAKEILAKDTKL